MISVLKSPESISESEAIGGAGPFEASSFSEAKSKLGAAVSGASMGISTAASAIPGLPAPGPGGPAPGPGIGDAASAVSDISKLPGADMAKNFLPPPLRIALAGIEMMSSALKPAKQVEKPDTKELEEGISDELLEQYISKKQFELELYHEYIQLEKKQDEEEDEEDIDQDKFVCKQIGGDDDEHPEFINTNLKEIINEKIICKHVKQMIVKNFEEFIEKKVVHPHFHSKNQKSNNIDTLSIFYRHGLSKIISKMMEDLKNNKEILDFFLDEIIKLVIDMEDKKMIDFLDNIDNNFLFEVMNSEKIIGFNNTNKNHETRMKKILLKLYPESEFNELMLQMEKNEKMSISEIKKWKEIYNNTLQKENQLEEKKQAEDKLLLEKIGLDKVLKLFKLNKTVKNITKIPTNYINKKTIFEDIEDNRKGGRITRKKRPII